MSKYYEHNSRQSWEMINEVRSNSVIIAAMYGRFWIRLFRNCRCYNYGEALHKAIQHKQYNFIESFMNDTMLTPQHRKDAWNFRKSSSWIGSNRTYITLIGTAIECNDLKVLKMILEWNQFNHDFENNEYRYNRLHVDNFAWCGNTAIQFAFMVCDDNYKMLQYLLKKHKAKFKNYDIDAVDDEDPRLVLKSIIKTRRNWLTDTEEEYTVVQRDKISGEITFKPDCESYTIDERIEMCRQNNKLTNEQCDNLLKILKKKRKSCVLPIV